MSLIAYQNSNKSKPSSHDDWNGRPQAGLSAIGDRLRKAIAKCAGLIMGFMATIAEAQIQRAAIEAELYLNRYRHSSKNDDDLPIVR